MLVRVRLPPLVGFRKFLSEYMHIKSFEFFLIYICLELCKPGQQTFCNFPRLRLSNGLFTELLANVVFFLFVLLLGLCVDVAVDRISRISIFPLPPGPFIIIIIIIIIITFIYTRQKHQAKMQYPSLCVCVCFFFFHPTHNSFLNTSDNYLKSVHA